MKKISLYIFLGLMFCNVVYAKSLFYGEYKTSTDDKDYIEHLKSVESGMSWMQLMSKKSLYCPPKNLKINLDTLRDAIELGLESLKNRNFSSQEIDNFPIELIMLNGLETIFPCN